MKPRPAITWVARRWRHSLLNFLFVSMLTSKLLQIWLSYLRDIIHCLLLFMKICYLFQQSISFCLLKSFILADDRSCNHFTVTLSSDAFQLVLLVFESTLQCWLGQIHRFIIFILWTFLLTIMQWNLWLLKVAVLCITLCNQVARFPLVFSFICLTLYNNDTVLDFLNSCITSTLLRDTCLCTAIVYLNDNGTFIHFLNVL